MEKTQLSPQSAARRRSGDSGGGTGGVSSRRSRLQMHAPASIQVGPAEPFSEWQTAIPLLSPLDVSPVLQSLHGSEKDEPQVSSIANRLEKDDKSSDTVSVNSSSSSSWRHPAEPFYYGNLQGKSAGFVFTHCG